ncbi:hypothetical protein GCM10023335_20680 [Streptomyces siamensis]|uniref:Uncharacterized protein n=1 Tax=Streptomyces siamensis TaxID=1274986 RepID=A0ABP9IRF1_9ACTN
MQQVTGVPRRMDLQDEQRDGDGDDAVAERDHPGGVALHAERRGPSPWPVRAVGSRPVRPTGRRPVLSVASRLVRPVGSQPVLTVASRLVRPVGT